MEALAQLALNMSRMIYQKVMGATALFAGSRIRFVSDSGGDLFRIGCGYF
jgi:hypothetical protein